MGVLYIRSSSGLRKKYLWEGCSWMSAFNLSGVCLCVTRV